MESEDMDIYNYGYRCAYASRKILSLTFDQFSTEFSVCSLIPYVRFVKFVHRTHLQNIKLLSIMKIQKF